MVERQAFSLRYLVVKFIYNRCLVRFVPLQDLINNISSIKLEISLWLGDFK